MRVSERHAYVAASLRDAGCGLKDAGRRNSGGFGFRMENAARVSEAREWNGLNASLGETRLRDATNGGELSDAGKLIQFILGI